MPTSFAAYADSRNNNLGVLRLFAAFLVLYGHCYPLTAILPKQHTPDPISGFFLEYLGFGKPLAGIGVSIFFFISGLLVAKSWLKCENPLIFITARASRIYPGLCVNVLFCVLVTGLLLTTLPVQEYLTHAQTRRFVIDNILAWRTQFLLPGVFTDLPWDSVNGSLWTLPMEIRMYGWCLVLGMLGLLKHRQSFNLFAVIALGMYLMRGQGFMLSQEGLDYLWIYFLLGMFAYVNAAFIPFHPKYLAALVIAALLMHGVDRQTYHLLYAISLAYAILLVSYAYYAKRLDIGRIGDFSYGIYLYAYPIQQLCIHYIRDITPLELCALSTILTLPLAVASWFLVEKPALRLKDWVQKRHRATSLNNSSASF